MQLTEPPVLPPDVPPVEPLAPPTETAEAAPQRNRRRPGKAAVAAMVLAVSTVGFAALCVTTRSDLNSARARIQTFEAADAARQAADDARPNLAEVISSYNLDRFEDSAATSTSVSLHLSGYSSSGWSSSLEACLDHLGFNASAVVSRMGNTRALDGTQSADGRHVHATWTYHPDHGLNVVLEVTG